MVDDGEWWGFWWIELVEGCWRLIAAPQSAWKTSRVPQRCGGNVFTLSAGSNRADWLGSNRSFPLRKRHRELGERQRPEGLEAISLSNVKNHQLAGVSLPQGSRNSRRITSYGGLHCNNPVLPFCYLVFDMAQLWITSWNTTWRCRAKIRPNIPENHTTMWTTKIVNIAFNNWYYRFVMVDND